MIEPTDRGWFCNVCSNDWPATAGRRSRESTLEARFRSLDDLIARTGLRRDEVVTLADIGALNAFGYDRRSALWQAERSVRSAGEMYAEAAESAENAGFPDGVSDPGYVTNSVSASGLLSAHESLSSTTGGSFSAHCADSADSAECPLRPMTEAERLVADFAGMGLSVGRHPMALRRDELAMRGVLRAIDLRSLRQGRRVRVAGMVITRQRPGTAKGFVFLTLEDETGIANIIVRPDLFARDRLVIVEEPFLIVEGLLQNLEGVTSVRAESVYGLRGLDVQFDAHDFY